jgi:porin
MKARAKTWIAVKTWCFAILTVLFALQASAVQAQSCDCETCSENGLMQRDNLFGDWLGIKPCLAESGIVVNGSLTQFYQGVASGGGEQRFRYGDKFDVFFAADTGKLGLWEGGKLASHAVDWQFGQNSIVDAVGLAPVNTAMLTPETEPSFAMTSLQYTQEIGENGWAATIGRINGPDLWSGFFPQYGRGYDGFMNASSLLPLSVLPSIPLITNGAGIMKGGERGEEFAFVVLENQHLPTTVGGNVPNGVTLLAVGRKYTDFGQLPGSHTLAGTYGTGRYTSFDTKGWDIIPGGGVAPAEQPGTWMAAYLGQQTLWADSCNQQRHTDLFGYVAFSDNNTSPFDWTASLSVETFGPSAHRAGDRMGIAYFYNALSPDFKNVFSLVTPLENIHGGEVYYNAEITPWFHLTLDLQVINPAIVARDTAFILGTRAKIDF